MRSAEADKSDHCASTLQGFVIVNRPAVTRLLAEFAADLSYQDLDAGLRNRLNGLLLDYFRAGLVGISAPWWTKLRNGLSGSMGSPVANIIYSNDRADPVRAAYINGVATGSLEWDDTHVGAMLHPGVVVWPAALAAGQMVGAPRSLVFAAAAAGYEAMIRIGLSVQPSHFQRGFQSTSTCGVFGAAVAAAKVLGLDAGGIRNAMGIAGSYAGGVTQFFLSGSEVKRLHAGKAAAAGVEAALFASAGLSGPPDIIEGRQGFAAALADAFEPDQILDGLGTRFTIMRLQLKVHALSARVLAAVEAAELLAAERVDPREISRIVIGLPQVVFGRLTNNQPRDLQQAQMSAPFGVAAALILAPERQGPFLLGIEECDAALKRSDIRALAAKAECETDPEVELASTDESVAGRVTIEMADGQRVSRIVARPLGSPERPMTTDALQDRFRALAQDRMSAEGITNWFGIVADGSSGNWAEQVMNLRPFEAASGEHR